MRRWEQDGSVAVGPGRDRDRVLPIRLRPESQAHLPARPRRPPNESASFMCLRKSGPVSLDTWRLGTLHVLHDGVEFLEELCRISCPASARAHDCRLDIETQHRRLSAFDETLAVPAGVFVGSRSQFSNHGSPCRQEETSKKARISGRATVRKKVRPTICG